MFLCTCYPFFVRHVSLWGENSWASEEIYLDEIIFACPWHERFDCAMISRPLLLFGSCMQSCLPRTYTRM